jgi:hypothetical protein
MSEHEYADTAVEQAPTGDDATEAQAFSDALDAKVAEASSTIASDPQAAEEAVREEISQSFQRLSTPPSDLDEAWSGRESRAGEEPEGNTSATAEPELVPADSAALRQAIEAVGLDDDSVSEMAAYVREHPELRARLFTIPGDDPELAAEALAANVDLVSQLRDGEQAQEALHWANAENETRRYQEQAAQWVEQAVEVAAEDPSQAPRLAAEFLLSGGDIDAIQDLVQLGDETYGPGQTLGYVQQWAAQQQQLAKLDEATSLIKLAQAKTQAEEEQATAAAERNAAMERPALELARRDPAAAMLVAQALGDETVGPQLTARMGDPEKAAAELSRLEQLAAAEIEHDRLSRRTVCRSNGWDPVTATDASGNSIAHLLSDRLVDPTTFLPPMNAAEQEAAFKASLQPSYYVKEPEQRERDPNAEQVGKQWREFEQSHDMAGAWTGRQTRR